MPCVGKLQRGSLGDGVFLLETELAASTSLKSMEKLGADIILQQFIHTGDPANDIRVFVIGAETKDPKVFAYKRYSLADDFRSNYTKSQSGEKVEITEEERLMSINASKAMKLGVCGVDIMRDNKDNNKPYIIETNSSPGLKGIETVTGENVAGSIIDYIISNYQKGGQIQTRAMYYGETIFKDVYDFYDNVTKAIRASNNNYKQEFLSNLYTIKNQHRIMMEMFPDEYGVKRSPLRIFR